MLYALPRYDNDIVMLYARRRRRHGTVVLWLGLCLFIVDVESLVQDMALNNADSPLQ